MRKWIWRAVRVSGGVAAGLAVLLLGCQERLMYFPHSYSSGQREEFRAAGGREVEHEISCGRQVAFYLPPRGAAGSGLPRRLWLVFAGNASLALDWFPVLREAPEGNGFLFIDYPGYGRCEGTPNPPAVLEGGTSAVRALARLLGVEPAALAARTGVLGHSLGAAAALMVAEELRLREVILIAPFTTMTEMALQVVGWPLGHLNRHRYDNRARVAALVPAGARIHIFHGTADDIIPLEMGRRLAETSPGITFHPLKGADHVTVIDEAQAAIFSLMREAAVPSPAR